MGGGETTGTLKHVALEEMKGIIEDYEELGREGSGVVVIDVRNPDEIARTGKLSPNTHTCLLYTSPSPRDLSTSRMPSSA